MKVFTCTDHDGHWPIGVASVIVAKDKRQARKLLDKELVVRGLLPRAEQEYTLDEVSLDVAQALVLQGGDY